MKNSTFCIKFFSWHILLISLVNISWCFSINTSKEQETPRYNHFSFHEHDFLKCKKHNIEDVQSRKSFTEGFGKKSEQVFTGRTSLYRKQICTSTVTDVTHFDFSKNLPLTRIFLDLLQRVQFLKTHAASWVQILSPKNKFQLANIYNSSSWLQNISFYKCSQTPG